MYCYMPADCTGALDVVGSRRCGLECATVRGESDESMVRRIGTAGVVNAYAQSAHGSVYDNFLLLIEAGAPLAYNSVLDALLSDTLLTGTESSFGLQRVDLASSGPLRLRR